MAKYVLFSLPSCPRCHVIEERLFSAKVDYEKEQDEEVILGHGLTEIPALLNVETKELYDFHTIIDKLNKGDLK